MSLVDLMNSINKKAYPDKVDELARTFRKDLPPAAESDSWKGNVKTYYDFSSSVNENYIPLEENIVRMMDHCCVYKMYEEKEEINFISITQVDTKYNLPNAMLSYQLPINYKKWYDSLINSLNEQKMQNVKSEIGDQNE